jgi:two-component system chemotaxis response regulator CheB
LLRQISVVVVDDSAFMRKSLSLMLESSEEIKVVATARDGEEGYNLDKKFRPDIVTLDIEMPKMDGLTALKKIMADCPTAVIMISSISTEGAEATLKAMEYGAVDFIPKDLSYVNVDIIKKKEELIRKVKEIVRQRLFQDRIRKLQITNKTAGTASTPSRNFSLPKINYQAVALGISTGGPMSLQKVLPILSDKIRIPIFIVQHMPPKFTKSLAERLNGLSAILVKEAEHDEIVKSGVAYIAPGGFHMGVKKNGSGFAAISISEQPATTLHRPSVDVMINSVLNIYGKSTLGVIMTGMGKDGLEGISKLKSLGGYSIAQNEETCVVYGMPRSVVEAGFADAILPLEEIAPAINKVLI